MYHCFCAVSVMLGARSEFREEEVDRLEKEEVASPQVNGEDERGDDDHDGRSDHFRTARPGDLLHLRVGVAKEIARGQPPLTRPGDDCVAVFFLIHRYPEMLTAFSPHPSAARCRHEG